MFDLACVFAGKCALQIHKNGFTCFGNIDPKPGFALKTQGIQFNHWAGYRPGIIRLLPVERALKTIDRQNFAEQIRRYQPGIFSRQRNNALFFTTFYLAGQILYAGN